MTGARTVSLTLGFLALALCLAYVGPDSWSEATRPGPQHSAVGTIDALGWVWPLAFLVVGLAMIGTVVAVRGMIVAHGLGAGVWGAYGATQMLWALLVEPPAPILIGVIATAVAVLHFGMARAWADQGVR